MYCRQRYLTILTLLLYNRNPREIQCATLSWVAICAWLRVSGAVWTFQALRL